MRDEEEQQQQLMTVLHPKVVRQREEASGKVFVCGFNPPPLAEEQKASHARSNNVCHSPADVVGGARTCHVGAGSDEGRGVTS